MLDRPEVEQDFQKVKALPFPVLQTHQKIESVVTFDHEDNYLGRLCRNSRIGGISSIRFAN